MEVKGIEYIGIYLRVKILRIFYVLVFDLLPIYFATYLLKIDVLLNF